MLIWVDVETTGLETKGHALLEVGMIATDDGLNELSRMSVLLQPPQMSPVFAKAIGPEVIQMHQDNNLWADARIEGVGRLVAQAILVGWIKRLDMPAKISVPMAGSTVHFDRMWLKARVPRAEALFHYRNLDVSTIKELNRRLKFAEPWDGDRNLHRALPDLEDSIAELRHYQDAIESHMATADLLCIGCG